MPSSPPTAPRERSLSTSPKLDEREVALELLARAPAAKAPVTLIGDKGYAGKEFATGQ